MIQTFPEIEGLLRLLLLPYLSLYIISKHVGIPCKEPGSVLLREQIQLIHNTEVLQTLHKV